MRAVSKELRSSEAQRCHFMYLFCQNYQNRRLIAATQLRLHMIELFTKWKLSYDHGVFNFDETIIKRLCLDWQLEVLKSSEQVLI